MPRFACSPSSSGGPAPAAPGVEGSDGVGGASAARGGRRTRRAGRDGRGRRGGLFRGRPRRAGLGCGTVTRRPEASARHSRCDGARGQERNATTPSVTASTTSSGSAAPGRRRAWRTGPGFRPSCAWGGGRRRRLRSRRVQRQREAGAAEPELGACLGARPPRARRGSHTRSAILGQRPPQDRGTGAGVAGSSSGGRAGSWRCMVSSGVEPRKSGAR